jgi:outer membrane protein assembly factor BamB
MNRIHLNWRHAVIGSLLGAFCFLSAAAADDWPQWLGPQRDGIWREKGIIEKFPSGGLKPRWSADIGSGYAGPAVAGGKVFVFDRLLAEGAKNPDNPFKTTPVPGKERLLCLDEKTGKERWKHEYDCEYQLSYAAGPRTTPLVQGEKVWTLGAMGDLFCVEADNGKVVWSKDLKKEYGAPVQMWGFSSSPLIDGDRLICLVGGKDSLVVAFDKNTGKEIWKSLTATGQGYSSPLIISAGGKRQLIVWEPAALHSLDPETGKEYWSEPVRSQSGMSICTPRLDGDKLLVSSFYNGSMMMKLDKDAPAATALWKGKGRGELPNQTAGLHSVMPTPFIRDGYIYGVCSHGELRCLNEETGERVWENLEATTKDKKPVRWANAFLTPVEGTDRCFLFNELGDLILARLSPKGYEEISRAHIIEPTTPMAAFGMGREPVFPVVWSHPAYADRCIFVRNDGKLVCVSLAAGGSER